jgi:hypothetical protein
MISLTAVNGVSTNIEEDEKIQIQQEATSKNQEHLEDD